MSGIISDNVLKQSGLIKAPAGGGAWTFIKKLTASSSSTLSFVDGSSDVVLDSTYPIYCFRMINIHPASDNIWFQVNFSDDTGSSYAVTKTTTNFMANHNESDSATQFGYESGYDLAQGTGVQKLNSGGTLDNNSDASLSGEIYLFNPSSTTFVKHFLITVQFLANNDYSIKTHIGGYCNTTSAVDAVQFTMSSGNIDAGSIFLHGLTT